MTALDNISPHQWPEDSIGASAQKEAPSPAQLGKQFPEAQINPKALTDEDRERHVQNIMDVYHSATPEERHAGFGWYAKAHREAVHMAQRVEPGQKQGPYRHPPAPEAVQRQAGNLAALSPAMDWDLNVKAANEIHSLSPEHVDVMRSSLEADKEVARTKRVAERAKGSPGESDAEDVHYSAKRAAAGIKEAARGPLQGMALNNQSTANAVKAYDIHSGRVAPEEALPMKIKTGNFYTNIVHPHDSPGATIDTRSADIAMGTRYPWKTPRGLSAVGRYEHFVGVHAEAAKRLSSETGLELTPSKVQATTWVADKRAMTAAKRGKHRQGTVADVHRSALQEQPNQPGPASKQMTGLNTAGRNRHGDDL